jgi:hypothetical protein
LRAPKRPIKGARTLDVTSELLAIAQIAVGMAGFAGVAAAILLDRSFQRDDQLRFLALFFSTMSVVVLSFVPSLLAHGGVTGPSVWRWASAAFFVWSVISLPLGLTIRREAHTFEKTPPKWAFLPLWGVFFSAPLGQLANLFGWLGGPGPLLYLFGLLAWLMAGAILFVIIVLLRPHNPHADT